MPDHRRTTSLLLVIVLAASSLLLSACGDKEPILLGFVAGVSGRTADLGIGGRNGLQLAIEQANAAGAIAVAVQIVAFHILHV